MQRLVGRGKSGGEERSPFEAIDAAVILVIVFFGVLQFFLYQHTHDYLHDDVFYAECARSLLHDGYYGINGRPETNQPPGLPILLALMSLVQLSSHASALRAMVVCETLGFLASYAFLRRRMPRGIAAVICLLLIASPISFALATQWVFPCYPYFFTTMGFLLVAEKLEGAAKTSSKILWGALLAILVVTSLLLASAAMALLGAVVAVIGTLFFRNRDLAFARMKIFLPVLLLGIAVQGAWMHRKPAQLEWPLPGYPRSYVQQLKVKNGNNPDLGLASPLDFPVRAAGNALAHSELLAQSLYKLWINAYWVSVLILGPVLVILIGWCYSVWRTGGELVDWYFAGYEFIYLLWPWSMEARFFLPVLPLACLYLLRGLEGIRFLATSKPRLLGVVWFPFGVFLALSAWLWERGAWFGRNALLHGGLQDEVSLMIWGASAMAAGWMAWTDSSPEMLPVVSYLTKWFKEVRNPLPLSALQFSRILAGIAVAVFVMIGLTMQLQVGRANLNYAQLNPKDPPDVEAALWVSAHTGAGDIVMAREVPTVYSYARRKTVWFPATSKAQLLMEGIRKHRINYVLVVKRKVSYYLPSDEDSFAALKAAYPEDFRLAEETPEFQIFRVASAIREK